MTTLTANWSRSRLFVKSSPVAFIPLPKMALRRLDYVPPKKLRLPAVGLGCILTVGDLAGMKAIRAGMLLAAINAHGAYIGGGFLCLLLD